MLALLILTLLAHALAQNCDYSQVMQPGPTYYITSPNYDASYPRNITCRWIATCPTGYQISGDCYLEIPFSSGCTGDRILVSRSGDPQLTNAETYCGTGRLNILSMRQALSIVLRVTTNSQGGRFRCDLTLQATAPPQQTCRCGITKRNRIVGGTNAGTNEYPMMAAFVAVASDRKPMCGGVIISSKYILTAAHCLENQSPSSLYVSVGNSRVRLGQNYTISSFSIHPNYNSATYDYDIALVSLQRELIFNDNIIPVCLPFKFRNVNLSGRYVTLLGWGTLFIGGPTPDVLQKVDVQLISQQQCQSSETVTSRQLCNLTPGKDACQMDSGGPALYPDPQTGLLMDVGIMSNGRSCASGSPGISTRVTEFLDWITQTAPAQYCVVP